MKTLHSIVLMLALIGPLCLSAQSITGSWLTNGGDADGNTWKEKITFNDDGTFTVDFKNDGVVDVQGSYKYEMDTKMITLSESNEQSPCYDKPGLYTIEIDGDKATVTMVDDPCEVRASDEPMVMTRM